MTARNRGNKAKTPQNPPEDAGDWVAIGEVVGVFGVHGELKVQPLTDFPQRFTRSETVYLGDSRVPYRIRGAHPHKRLLLVSLEGIDDPETGAKLRGAHLWIPLAQITPLPEDQFYLHDVIGLRVRHVNGQALGMVTDVLTSAGNDLFVVHAAPSGREILLPVVKEFVKRVDVPGGEIVVDPIPGIFDDDAIVAGGDEDEDEAAERSASVDRSAAVDGGESESGEHRRGR